MSSLAISNDHTQHTTASMHLQALNLLCAIGWHYLPPSTCLAKRGNRRQVLLQSTLVEVLQTRRYIHQGQSHLLTPNGIEQIVRELSAISLQPGLAQANAQLYEKLRLGITITEFLPDGKKHQPTIPVIDWQNRKANRFEVCDQFEVQSTQGRHTRTAGLVCFVNGIPLAVLEAPMADPGALEDIDDTLLQQGITRHLQHQQSKEIPLLYAYSQLLFSLSPQDARYATTLTPASGWTRWREEQYTEDYFLKLAHTPLSVEARSALQAEQALALRNQLKRIWAEPAPLLTPHMLIMSLLNPQRLLDFLCSFVLFDPKAGKLVARSQQFFAVRAIIERIGQRNEKGTRQGGIVWHTTGSGKFFTMVFLSRALLQQDGLKECRIVVVTERTEMEAQLAQSFTHGMGKPHERHKIRSGHDLARRISSGNERIIFTLVHKFHAASSLDLCYNPSHQLIVLVDEGHRSQHAELHARMRKALPRAAFVAFTGTPLQQREKAHNSFGPLLHTYDMHTALQDRIVLPLLYEERPLPAVLDEAGRKRWFSLSTQGQTHTQQQWQAYTALLEASGPQIRIAMLAWDIAQHFAQHMRPLGLKGMLVANQRSEALLYHKLWQDSGLLRSALVLAPPEQADGEVLDEAAQAEFQNWWQAHTEQSTPGCEKQVLQAYSQVDGPEILIVVERLLNSLNEPNNSVLYLDKPLQDYQLLQAIARVNRPRCGKQYGVLLDYRGVLQALDTSVPSYRQSSESHAGYDRQDILGMYRQMASEYLRLPQLHQALLGMFGLDEERVELDEKLYEQLRQVLLPQLVEDGTGSDRQQKMRHAFYTRLADFALCLHVALSSRSFFSDANFAANQLQSYQQSLVFFSGLRQIAIEDAQETSNHPVLDGVLHLLLQKLGANPLLSTHPDGDSQTWSEAKLRNESGLLRNRLRRAIEHDLADDPYAQQVYTQRLADTMQEVQSLKENAHQQYALLRQLEQQLMRRQLDGMPEIFSHRPQAATYYGLLKLVLGESHFAYANAAQQSAYLEQALAIDDVVQPAIRENTLNPDNIDTIIRSKLLPRLFLMLGMEQARKVTDLTVQIAHLRASRQAGLVPRGEDVGMTLVRGSQEKPVRAE